MDTKIKTVKTIATLAESFRILRSFWPLALFATLAGGISGVASAALLATINQAVHGSGDGLTGILVAFVGLCVVSLLGDLLGNLGNNLVGQRIIAKLRRELSLKIVAAPLAEIERFQPHRLLTILGHDIDNIAGFTFNFAMIVIAFSITVGCFVYLVILSPIMFSIVIAATMLMFAGQVVASRLGVDSYFAVRDAQDQLQKNYRAIIEGAKEIRISRGRRARVLEHLVRAIEQIAKKFVHATRVFFVARAFNSVFFFVTIFIVLATSARAPVGNTALSGFILVLLYVRSPIEQIVAAMPLLGQAQVSFRKVAELSAAIGQEQMLITAEPGAASYTASTIELCDVCYEFAKQDGVEPFTLGPVNLKIGAGETVFIVGKNGCGKTTLIKLLMGLYVPQKGQLLCDGREIESSELDAYRQLFSAIFFDYYLFDDLVAADADTLQEANQHLKELQIVHKVSIRDGAYSTTDLSTGQRKRLALIHVFLENRPVIVLDEWAADQDPSFRRVFYEELLPNMKRRGKTLIIVSHDESYFHIADRVIELDAGKIVHFRASSDVNACVRAG